MPVIISSSIGLPLKKHSLVQQWLLLAQPTLACHKKHDWPNNDCHWLNRHNWLGIEKHDWFNRGCHWLKQHWLAGKNYWVINGCHWLIWHFTFI